MRHCDRCVHQSNGSCTSWDCEFIDRAEAIKAWREMKQLEKEKAEEQDENRERRERCLKGM